MAMNMTRKSQTLMKIVNGSLWDLPSPSSMSYFWNFGSTLGICLMIQILTGLVLSFQYTSYSPESFYSVVKIMREVWFGWALRLIHMNGASMFFLFIYLHLMRGIYYQSHLHKKVWMSGVTIMILLMAISFLGYVLPWGQMSYWAVAVITNLFSVVPVLKEQLVFWMWGGFSVSSPTLTRFYSLHFLLPFVLSALVIFHLFFLHEQGSSNSVGVDSNVDKIPFHPYFSIKDTLFILTFILGAYMLSSYFPYILGDPVNNIPANPMQTPAHIQPEWYFLSFYAILRAFASKVAGVLALGLSVSILYLLPMFNSEFFPSNFNAIRSVLFWMFVASFIFLMTLGALPAEEPYIMLSKIGTFFYFSIVMILNL